MNGWGLWRVVGLNTSTWEHSSTAWQFFQKVFDCVVHFPDANLEFEIRAEIEKPFGPILASDLQLITYLAGGAEEISDITGLEYCTNLTALYLWNNPLLTDISPLAGLVQLTELSLLGNNIGDVDPLAGLVNVLELDLAGNQVSDLTPLVGLVDLDLLDLSENQISDLTPLADVTSLRHLELYGNEIVDLSPLAGLAGLHTLYLNRNEISDLAPLAGLSALEWLILAENQISDLTPLGELTMVWTLSLNDNLITDISPLLEIPALYSLISWTYLQGNPLSFESCYIYIPELEQYGAGVVSDCT